MIKIYGCSDDNVEVEGDIRDEFGAYSPVTLIFSNGTHIRAEYCPGNYPGWKLEVLKVGTGECKRTPCPMDAKGELLNEDNYTDIIELSTKIEWIECWDTYPPTQSELLEKIEQIVEEGNIRTFDTDKLLKIYRMLARG